MTVAYLVAGVRTPIGRYAGALAGVRPDDLAAHVLARTGRPAPGGGLGAGRRRRAGLRQPGRRGQPQRGPDGGAAGRPAARRCRAAPSTGSAAPAWTRWPPPPAPCVAGEADLVLAGGVESMSRAPFVMPKADAPYSRAAEVYDTTLGWRLVNPLMANGWGIDSMPETAENVAAEFGVDRARAGRLRAALPAAGRQGAGRRPVRRGDRAGDRAGRPAGDPAGRGRRAPPGDHACEVGRAAHPVPRRRHGHRRQLLRRQRRCGGPAGGLPRRRCPVRSHPAGPDQRRGGGRRTAPDHGDRPGAGHPQLLDRLGVEPGRRGRDRVERGVRRAGHGGACASWACRRTPSTSTRTAARSRWGTRSAPAAPGWR